MNYKDSEYVLNGKLITDYGLVDLKLIDDEKYYKEALKKGFEGGEYKKHCKKRQYDNFEEGYKKLNEINGLVGKVVMTRVYECAYCGKWHLTSKTSEQYEANAQRKQDTKYRVKIKLFNSFISKEVRYWEKKLKLKG